MKKQTAIVVIGSLRVNIGTPELPTKLLLNLYYYTLLSVDMSTKYAGLVVLIRLHFAVSDLGLLFWPGLCDNTKCKYGISILSADLSFFVLSKSAKIIKLRPSNYSIKKLPCGHFEIFFIFFPENRLLTFHANCFF